MHVRNLECLYAYHEDYMLHHDQPVIWETDS